MSMINPSVFQEVSNVFRRWMDIIIPLSIKDGLACLSIRPYTDHEWDNLPLVILTSELEWDPVSFAMTLKKMSNGEKSLHLIILLIMSLIMAIYIPTYFEGRAISTMVP
jgi:hypothetical protein